MSVKVTTKTIESFSWNGATDATRSEAEAFHVELGKALGVNVVESVAPVAQLKATEITVEEKPRQLALKDLPVAISSGDYKVAQQAMLNLYGPVIYRTTESELAARIASAKFTMEEYHTMKTIMNLMVTYNKLSMEKVQLDLGLRPFQFEKLFEVFFQGTFATVYREIAMEKGRIQIKENPTTKIADIAHMLGYSKSGFRSSFTNAFSISPNDYRIRTFKESSKQKLSEMIAG